MAWATKVAVKYLDVEKLTDEADYKFYEASSLMEIMGEKLPQTQDFNCYV
jgi:hypothetical protein